MPNRKNSEAKIRANNKYSSEHYDRINLALPKGSRRIVDYCAQKHNESVNRYICRIVLEAARKELNSERVVDVEFFDLF